MREWDDFRNDVQRARQELGCEDHDETFYRGHGDSRWPLLPSILRHERQAGLSKVETRKVEMNLFFEFRARARELHQYALSDWEVLQFMRHHGVATRLLDWTEVLGVALYFAFSGAVPGKVPCIWILNPFTLNKHKQSFGYSELIAPEYMVKNDWDYSDYMNTPGLDFWWKHPVALYPEQKSARLHAQRGYFTVHGSRHEPLEKINRKVVRRVDIPAEAMKDVEEFLELAGINHHLLFPDLDGLARDLHRKNKIL